MLAHGGAWMTSRISNGLGFVESVSSLSSLITCRRAALDSDKEEIYRLRYDAYKREGALPAGAPLIFKDRFDESPNGSTFGFYVDGRLAGSIRLHVATRETPDVPAMVVFSEFLAPRVTAGAIVIDPTRFVVDA